MAKDPEPGAVARAARLREQINRLKNPDKSGTASQTPDAEQPESPREFIQRRMRELDKKDES